MEKLRRLGLFGLVALLLACFWAGLWYQGQRDAAVILTGEEKARAEQVEDGDKTEDDKTGGTVPVGGGREAGGEEVPAFPTAADNPAPAESGAERPGGKAEGSAAEGAGGGIAVHVVGAVKEPGLYFLPGDSRIYDAVNLAGPEEKADLARLNLALPAEDGMQIRVPLIGRKDQWESGALVLRAGSEESLGESGAGESGKSGLLNLNQATAAELTALPGIGQVYAERILRYREENKGFKSVEELRKIKGIGAVKFAELKELVCCG